MNTLNALKAFVFRPLMALGIAIGMGIGVALPITLAPSQAQAQTPPEISTSLQAREGLERFLTEESGFGIELEIRFDPLAAHTEDVSINYTINTNGTAMVGQDFYVPDGGTRQANDTVTGTITIPAGGLRQSLVIFVNDDMDDEAAEETLFITLDATSIVGATIDTNDQDTVFRFAIQDDDPLFDIETDQREVTEGGTIAYRIRPSIATNNDANISYSFSPTNAGLEFGANITRVVLQNGSDATPFGMDSTANPNGYTIPYPAGAEFVTFTAHVQNDGLATQPDSAYARLTGAGVGQSADARTRLVTPVIDAEPFSISISPTRPQVIEGETVEFDIVLTSPLATEFEVVYNTTEFDGAGMARGEASFMNVDPRPHDYLPSHGQLVFAPGETRKRVRVETLDNTVDDQFGGVQNALGATSENGVREFGFLVRGTPSGGSEINSTTEIFIEDNDDPPQWYLIGPSQVSEGDNVEFRLASRGGVKFDVDSGVGLEVTGLSAETTLRVGDSGAAGESIAAGGDNQSVTVLAFQESEVSLFFAIPMGATGEELRVKILSTDELSVGLPTVRTNAYSVDNRAGVRTASVVAAGTAAAELPELMVTGPTSIRQGQYGGFRVRSQNGVRFNQHSVVMVNVGGNATGFRAGGFEREFIDSDDNLTVDFPANALASEEFFIRMADAENVNLTAVLVPLNNTYTVTRNASGDPVQHVAFSSGVPPGDFDRSDTTEFAELTNMEAIAHVAGEATAATTGLISDRISNRVSDSLAGRFGFSVEGGSFADWARAEAQREADENPWDVPDASTSLVEAPDLHDLAFVLPLHGGDAGGVGVWGTGYTRGLDFGERNANFDGMVTGGMIGVDFYATPHVLVGIGFGSASAELDISLDGESGVDTHETELTSYHPYIGWEIGDGSVWAALGFGEGDVTLDVVTQADDYEATVETMSYSAGFTNVLNRQATGGGSSVALSLKGDASYTAIEETPSAQNNPALYANSGTNEADTSHVRLGLAVEFDREFGRGGTLTSSVEFAGRYDMGDGRDGKGLEIAAGIGLDTADGLQFGLDGRTLVFHADDVDADWGIAGSVAWLSPAARSSGRGLALTFTPSWGNSASQADAIFGGEFADFDSLASESLGDAGDDALATSYAYDVRYGIGVLGRGLLTPFVAGDAGDAASVVYGSRFDFGNFGAGVAVDDADADETTGYVKYSREF